MSVCVYRSPSGEFDVFVDALSGMLDFLYSTHDQVILCGDLNVNINLNTIQSRVASDVFLIDCMGTHPCPSELSLAGMVLLQYQLSIIC